MARHVCDYLMVCCNKLMFDGCVAEKDGSRFGEKMPPRKNIVFFSFWFFFGDCPWVQNNIYTATGIARSCSNKFHSGACSLIQNNIKTDTDAARTIFDKYNKVLHKRMSEAALCGSGNESARARIFDEVSAEYIHEFNALFQL